MSKRSVYVVDDEEPIRRSLKLMLTVMGHSVSVFESGMAILEQVPDLAPAVLLLDIRMPEIDGLEVLRRLAATRTDLPVVVMTGHGDLATAVSALRLGAVAFLDKPFARVALAEALDAAFLKLENPDAYAARLSAAAEAVAALRPEEAALLTALATGQTTDALASELGLTTPAAEVRRARIFAELGVESANEAIRIAFAAGIQTGDPLRDIT